MPEPEFILAYRSALLVKQRSAILPGWSGAADECLDAILECWNPAERGAEAIVSVLLGASSQDIRWQDSFEITETGFVIRRERKFYDYHKL